MEKIEKLKVLKFSLLSFIGAMLHIEGTIMTFHLFPAIFLSFSNAYEGSIVAFLSVLMIGIFKSYKIGFALKLILAVEFSFMVYLFSKISKKTNTFIASIFLMITSLILVFTTQAVLKQNLNFLYIPYAVNMFFNVLLAILINKGLENPNQKGVIARWLNNR